MLHRTPDAYTHTHTPTPKWRLMSHAGTGTCVALLHLLCPFFFHPFLFTVSIFDAHTYLLSVTLSSLQSPGAISRSMNTHLLSSLHNTQPPPPPSLPISSACAHTCGGVLLLWMLRCVRTVIRHSEARCLFTRTRDGTPASRALLIICSNTAFTHHHRHHHHGVTSLPAEFRRRLRFGTGGLRRTVTAGDALRHTACILSGGNKCELVSVIQRALIFSAGSHLLFAPPLSLSLLPGS